ncbi:hypothetical protein [Vibrio chemaguriensis]
MIGVILLNLRKFIEYVAPEDGDFLYATTVRAVSKWIVGDDFLDEQRQLLSYLDDYDLAPLLNEESNERQLSSLKDRLSSVSTEGIGFAIAPYLFIWNIRRFDKYSEYSCFDIVQYFYELNGLFDDNKSYFALFKDNHLRFNPISLDDIRSLYQLFNEKLKKIGIGQNEYVGLMKLTHLINPFAFPIIDNDIAKGVKLIGSKKDSLSIEKCVQWHSLVSACISGFDENETTDFEKQGVSLVRALDLAMMHYRIDPSAYSKASNKNKYHIRSLGFKI